MVVIFEFVHGILKFGVPMKAIEKYFPVVLFVDFVTFFNVVLTCSVCA